MITCVSVGMEVGRLDVGLRERLKREKRRGLRALANAHVSLEDGAKYWGAGGGRETSLEAVRKERSQQGGGEQSPHWRGLYTVELPALSVG